MGLFRYEEEIFKFLEKEQIKFFDTVYSDLVENIGPIKAETYLLAHYLSIVAELSTKSNTSFEEARESIFSNLDRLMIFYNETEKKEKDGTI